MTRWLLSVLSPAATGARLTILIFHRVLPAADALFPEEMHAERFRLVCSWLRQWCNVLPLAEACRRLVDRTLPARALCITFDDGYADNHDVALPILREYGLHATFFVATGFLDGGRMWNDTIAESIRRTRKERLDLRELATELELEGIGEMPTATLAERRAAFHRLVCACRYLPAPRREQAVQGVARVADAALPNDLMMTSAQLRSMAAHEMTIGGHTVSHPILTRLSLAQAREEIVGGRQRLQELLQSDVRLFAYPNGRPGADYHAEHAALVQQVGFDAAVTTGWGVAGHATDRFQLPRFTPWDHTRFAFGLRLARNIGIGPPPVRFV